MGKSDKKNIRDIVATNNSLAGRDSLCNVSDRVYSQGTVIHLGYGLK
jgi:hypothetical protein